MNSKSTKKFLLEWAIAVASAALSGSLCYFLTGSFILTAVASIMAVVWAVSTKLLYDNI